MVVQQDPKNGMKKVIIFYLLIFLSACSLLLKENQENRNIVITGSNTVHPIVKSVSFIFSKEHPGTQFSVSAGGSNTGLEALRQNTTDLAVSSREMKHGEKLFFRDRKIEIIEEIIAYDALGIIVHPSNPVHKLTLTQVNMIFSGIVTNWKELGGMDHEILIIRRDSSSSGTDDFFNKVVLDGREPAGNVRSQIYNDDIIADIKNNPHAISYMGYGYLNDMVKTIALSGSNKKYYYPTKETIQSLQYPLIRPLYAYYRKEKRKRVQDFVNYILAPKGQQLVEEVNYIPRKMIDQTHLHILPI